MIADVLTVYGAEVAAHKPFKSKRQTSYSISNLLGWWGARTAADISTRTCRDYCAGKAPATAGADIKTLKAAVKYWHEEYGPLNFIPSYWKPAPNAPKDRWLTRSEAARLLKAAKPYQHLRRLILLGLYTGSRPGVILALTWDQVDLKNRMLSRVPAGVKQDRKKRAPKVRLGWRILSHLKRWHRIDRGQGFVCHFGGQQIVDPHTAWKKTIKAAKLKGVTRHTLRHTRATWMMQAGVPIWEAAGFLGMTVKTLEKVYGHHSPEHMDRAANI